MPTLRTGISTSGLASSPLPSRAFTRLPNDPGKYKIALTLTKGMGLEIITDGYTFNHFAGLVNEINVGVWQNHQSWVEEYEALAWLASQGVDLTTLARPLQVVPTIKEQ